MPYPNLLVMFVGNGTDINQDAKFGEYMIDFPAVAEHLYQLNIAARARGGGIALVIFDSPFLPKLFATPRGNYLQKILRL